MDWIQVVALLLSTLALVGSNFGMFLWSRSESREDSRRIEGLVASIQAEIKDFHGRLCAIEERAKEVK